MTTPEIIATVLPFAIAFAMTHLIVLPFKAFFIDDDLWRIAVQATIWNILAVLYAAGVLFLFGVETQSLFWGVVKFLPVFLIFAFSIAIWLYIMMRATKKYMLVDVSVFTILALAAS